MKSAIELARAHPGKSPAANPVSVAAQRPAQVLWTVQTMRGAAALMVVAGHVQSAVGGLVAQDGGRFERINLIPWGASVDLFFVISGFITVHSSGRLFGQPGARATFLRRRLTRIVPLYWAITTIFLLLLGAATLKGGDPFPTIGGIAASYAFVPADTYGDGRWFPVYDLGWTLNYEMLFYAVLAVAVGWPRRRALWTTAAVIVALVVLGYLVPPDSVPGFWTRPIIVDFGLGLAVGAMTGRLVLPVPVRWALVAAALLVLLPDPTGLFAGPLGATVPNEWPRVLLAGVPMAAILAAAVLGPEPAMPAPAAPLVRLGDASYSLYLMHPFALIAMDKLAHKTTVLRHLPPLLLVVATIVVALAIAFAGNRLVERPLTEAVARRFVGRPRAPDPRPAPAAE